MRIVTQSQSKGRRTGLLSRLRSEAGGAVLLEFALVAGPFIAILLAVLQTALIFFSDQLLQTATQSVAREILTGNVQQTPMTQADFKALACSKLPTFMNCTDLTVDVTKVTSFANADTSNPLATYTAGVPSFPNRWQVGGAGDIIMVRLVYPWSVVGAPNGLTLASLTNGKFLLVGTTLTRTEPYS